MPNNISHFRNCYGCGVCAIICPKKIIDLKENKNGFYEPYIKDPESCNDCGLCLSVCSFNDKEVSTIGNSEKFYAGWSLSEDVRKKCSSGGVAFELAAQLFKEGWMVCGVKYNNEKQRAEHFVARSEEEYLSSRGSKYLQSYTLPGFLDIDKNDRYMVTGTPCQIDSFRRYIRKVKKEDNFILMDFFCHGVPSRNLWKSYLKTFSLDDKIKPDSAVCWRNKKEGWHRSSAISVGDKSGGLIYHSSFFNGDLFYKFFLSDLCLNRSCYSDCKFKLCSSAADIRIGDLWGKQYKHDESGVNGIITLTEKGENLIKICNLQLIGEKDLVVMEVQMKKSPIMPWIYNLVQKKLSTYTDLRKLEKLLVLYRYSILPRRIVRKIKRSLK